VFSGTKELHQRCSAAECEETVGDGGGHWALRYAESWPGSELLNTSDLADHSPAGEAEKSSAASEVTSLTSYNP
jgi:hypothetical protein